MFKTEKNNRNFCKKQWGLATVSAWALIKNNECNDTQGHRENNVKANTGIHPDKDKQIHFSSVNCKTLQQLGHLQGWRDFGGILDKKQTIPEVKS